LDGVLPLLPAGIVERPVADGVVEISAFGVDLPADAALREAAARPIDHVEYLEVPADWRERRRRFGGGSVLIDGRLVVRTPDVRHVIVSGIVEGEMEEVRGMYAAVGLTAQRGMAADTWIAMLLERES